MTSSGQGRRGWLVVLVVTALVVAACGGDDGGSDGSDGAADSDDGGGSDEGSGGSTGSIDDPPPSGQATASVDGLDLVFDMTGAVDCSISDESITYSYRIGDNEVTLGGGVNRVDDGWMGNITLNVANPDGEDGPIAYYPALGDEGLMDESLFVVDGESAMYEGPMLKQPANDGSLPEPVDVGTGTIIATC